MLVDGRVVGRLERSNPRNLTLPAAARRDGDATLDILVEALGRVNFGCEWDFKGLTSPDVRLNGAARAPLLPSNFRNSLDMLHRSDSRLYCTLLQPLQIRQARPSLSPDLRPMAKERMHGMETVCASECTRPLRICAAALHISKLCNKTSHKLEHARATQLPAKALEQAAEEAALVGPPHAEALQQPLEALVPAQELQVGVGAQLVRVLVPRLQAPRHGCQALARLPHHHSSAPVTLYTSSCAGSYAAVVCMHHSHAVT